MVWRALTRLFIALALPSAVILFFAGCGTTNAPRALPPYEPPIAKASFQTVHTTAYTHTESDHLEYANHNALGGVLQAADPPVHRAQNRIVTLALEQQSDYQRVSYSGGPQPFSMEDNPPPVRKTVARALPVTIKTVRGHKIVIVKAKPPRIGSAAADWSRWPAGTTFRLLSTGQIYRVDDYGWALAGRNTIDLYMATPADMDSWGAREEPIQILQWGDASESLRLLQPHQDYKHVRRMVLELEGHDAEAAQLR